MWWDRLPILVRLGILSVLVWGVRQLGGPVRAWRDWLPDGWPGTVLFWVSLTAGLVVLIGLVRGVIDGARDVTATGDAGQAIRDAGQAIRADRARRAAERAERQQRLAAKYGADLQPGETAWQAIRRHRREQAEQARRQAGQS